MSKTASKIVIFVLVGLILLGICAGTVFTLFA